MKKNLKDLYNKTADSYYLSHTSKTTEDLHDYMQNERFSWSDGLTGNEWEDEAECKMCAEEAATQVIEREADE